MEEFEVNVLNYLRFLEERDLVPAQQALIKKLLMPDTPVNELIRYIAGELPDSIKEDVKKCLLKQALEEYSPDSQNTVEFSGNKTVLIHNLNDLLSHIVDAIEEPGTKVVVSVQRPRKGVYDVH